MSETSLTLHRPGRSCECAEPEVDDHGFVYYLQTCPVCMSAVLDNIRGVVYSKCYVKGVRRRVRQQEFFSFSPYSQSGTQKVISSGKPSTKRPT